MSDRIEVDDRIYPGQERVSPSGKYQLVFQEDSNFVLYRRTGEETTAIWASNTYSDEGSMNHSVILQADGRFVMYNANGQVIWESESNDYQPRSPYIQVQDDGNVCLYDNEVEGCHWSTNTYEG